MAVWYPLALFWVVVVMVLVIFIFLIICHGRSLQGATPEYAVYSGALVFSYPVAVLAAYHSFRPKLNKAGRRRIVTKSCHSSPPFLSVYFTKSQEAVKRRHAALFPPVFVPELA